MNTLGNQYPGSVEEAVNMLHANSASGPEMMPSLNLATSYQETKIFMWMTHQC